jgi:hypothetical protein
METGLSPVNVEKETNSKAHRNYKLAESKIEIKKA